MDTVASNVHESSIQVVRLIEIQTLALHEGSSLYAYETSLGIRDAMVWSTMHCTQTAPWYGLQCTPHKQLR